MPIVILKQYNTLNCMEAQQFETLCRIHLNIFRKRFPCQILKGHMLLVLAFPINLRESAESGMVCSKGHNKNKRISVSKK